MPNYEYQCKACDERFEAYHPVEERAKLSYCPKCGFLGQRLISASVSANTGKGSRFPGECWPLPGEPYIKSKYEFKERVRALDGTTYE